MVIKDIDNQLKRFYNIAVEKRRLTKISLDIASERIIANLYMSYRNICVDAA